MVTESFDPVAERVAWIVDLWPVTETPDRRSARVSLTAQNTYSDRPQLGLPGRELR